jgi:hypothetical protein
MTLPKVNHTAGEYTIYVELAGAVWYGLVLRTRLQRREAGPYRTPHEDPALAGD